MPNTVKPALRKPEDWKDYLVNQIDTLLAIRLELQATDCPRCRHYENDLCHIDAELRDLYKQLAVCDAKLAKKNS
jgi:hypothetical protein